MNLLPSKTTSQKALLSHSWLGLASGALMYLICLSGALVVLNPFIERWEQPAAEEYRSIGIEKLQQAYESALANEQSPANHLFIMLPTEQSPRAKISSGNGSFYVNSDGKLGEQVSHGFMDIITNLHVYLHLPYNWGMVVVSIIGVALCALVISGFFAHRRLIKDAFSMRVNGSKSKQQTDIHNRLSVWLSPFHLMFGVTGAYFGLAGLLATFYAAVYFNGDEGAIKDAVYAAEPELTQPVEPANLPAALEELARVAPDADPFYITLEKFNTPGQYMLIGASLPERLIYAEQYRFDNQGNYLSNVGFSDGEPGRQAVFSVFRLHFGHFGPLIVQLFYVFLGIALSIVSVTGVNMWLAKRSGTDYINHLWTGVVWGTPLVIVAAALIDLITGFSSIWIFWGGLAVTMFISWRFSDHPRSKWLFLVFSLLLALAVVVTHSAFFGADAWRGGALVMNLVWLISALSFATLALLVIKASHRR